MKNVLFICTGNSCRSQMAEGWVGHLLKGRVAAYSAGVETHGLNPYAVQVMAESGVDISHQASHHIDQYTDQYFDLVVTVCSHAAASCPVFLKDCRTVHAPFDDPPAMAKALAEQGASEEEQLDCYRRVRDEIRLFAVKLPSLLAEQSGPDSENTVKSG